MVVPSSKLVSIPTAKEEDDISAVIQSLEVILGPKGMENCYL